MAEIISSNRIYRCREPFKIEYIPEVMKRIGWEKSAYIMNKWFSLEAKEMLEDEKTATKGYTYDKYDKNYVDKTTFTMEWIKSFKRGNDAYDELLKNLNNNAAKKELSDKTFPNILRNIDKDILNSNIGKDFLYSVESFEPEEIHKEHFQRVEISYDSLELIINFGNLDDLYGSLGKFSIYATISKYKVQAIKENKYRLTITEVMIYMKDTYEFLGRQYLGHWNCNKVMIDPLSIKLADFATEIGNDDFNKYRKENKKGGDMLLFSDVKKESTNIVVEI